VLHDFNKFWEMMRREKRQRAPALTEAQRKAKPPVSHPVFLPHPITGRKALYANPGYSMRINELPQKESDAILEFLFRAPDPAEIPASRRAGRWRRADVGQPAQQIHTRWRTTVPTSPRLIKRLPGDGDAFLPGKIMTGSFFSPASPRSPAAAASALGLPREAAQAGRGLRRWRTHST